MKTSPLLFLAALALLLTPAGAQSVFINELHYDNVGGDANEGVEIAGPAGTDLSVYKLVFYNGANGLMGTELPLGGTLPAQNGIAFGTAFFAQAGIQNGAPDGIALIDTVANSVVQFLSYEGSFVANNGDAAGESSFDIGVSESGSTSPTESLQLVGSGAVYSDFTWQPPATASPAMINSGQIFLGAGDPMITLTLMSTNLDEGTATTATVALFPSPAAPVSISILNPDPSEISTPTNVTVSMSGSATFQVSAVDDSLNDGNQTVTLTATDPSGFYDADSATGNVIDIQRPTRGTAIRIATVNTLNGVGARGSTGYNDLLTLIGRIEPDIISFQEVSSTGNFFNLRALVADLGLPHLATTGEPFANDPYDGGRFNTNQNLAIASLYPFKRDGFCPGPKPLPGDPPPPPQCHNCSPYQIERGAPNRKEVTRYPLLAEIDVPGTTNDPTIIAVHYKASQDEPSQFRKAVEAYRTIQGITAAGHVAATENIFVLGDFNQDHERPMPASFNTGDLVPDLPQSFQLGEDITGKNAITIPYDNFPDRIFGDAGFNTPLNFQQDNVGKRTFNLPGSGAALDYIIHSQNVTDNGNFHTEIYNSTLDGAFHGLEKQGNPAPPSISFTASDHFVVFGDYELDPKPTLSLSITPFSHNEDAGNAAATGTITLLEAPNTPLTIELSKLRPNAPVSLPTTTVTILPGHTQATFPIDVIDRRTADPNQTITITAQAEGYSGTNGSIRVNNLDVSGRILFSQYIEPPSGNAPRGIELFNCGPDAIDLTGEPIHINQYTNGSSFGNRVAVAERGILPAGGVVVIGDTTMGNYLVAEGLFPAPSPSEPISNAASGTHYFNAAGELVFVKDFFAFNGDDALEVQFAYGLSDVFGTIGKDPGSAWQSNGVSTSGRNLSLLAGVGTPSAGFTQPHLRFANTAPGNDLSGFGIAPTIDDPFKIWLLSFGLADPNADPDCDGIVNLVEFATGSDPTMPDSANPPSIDGLTYSFRRLQQPGRLVYSVETSTDLLTWTSANLNQIGTSPNGDDTETVTFNLQAGNRGFYRLSVILE